MSLLIVVGYDGPGASAKPFPVYMGRISSEADAAMASSPAARFEIIRNPVVLRKNGKRFAAAPVVAVEPQPETVEPLPFSDPMPEPAAIEPAEADTATPSEDPDPDSAAPAGISGKRKK